VIVDTDRLIARDEAAADEPMVRLDSTGAWAGPRVALAEVGVDGAGRIGTTDSAAAAAIGAPRADRRALPVSDLTLAEEFYEDVLGQVLGGYYVISRYPSTTMDLRRAGQMARLVARGRGEDLVGRTMHYSRIVVGRSHLILYLTDEDVQEPPPDQLRGLPRVAICVTEEQLDTAIERFRVDRIPFDGPVVHPAGCPAAQSIYLKDPCGNFLELCQPRSAAENASL
jgi:extradiol dioxygenase family protein